jgi:hypothetical protein
VVGGVGESQERRIRLLRNVRGKGASTASDGNGFPKDQAKFAFVTTLGRERRFLIEKPFRPIVLDPTFSRKFSWRRFSLQSLGLCFFLVLSSLVGQRRKHISPVRGAKRVFRNSVEVPHRPSQPHAREEGSPCLHLRLFRCDGSFASAKPATVRRTRWLDLFPSAIILVSRIQIGPFLTFGPATGAFSRRLRIGPEDFRSGSCPRPCGATLLGSHPISDVVVFGSYPPSTRPSHTIVPTWSRRSPPYAERSSTSKVAPGLRSDTSIYLSRGAGATCGRDATFHMRPRAASTAWARTNHWLDAQGQAASRYDSRPVC